MGTWLIPKLQAILETCSKEGITEHEKIPAYISPAVDGHV